MPDPLLSTSHALKQNPDPDPAARQDLAAPLDIDTPLSGKAISLRRKVLIHANLIARAFRPL